MCCLVSSVRLFTTVDFIRSDYIMQWASVHIETEMNTEAQKPRNADVSDLLCFVTAREYIANIPSVVQK